MMLIETKLRPPRLADDLVSRPALMARLDEAVRAPVTAIIAPAGYGKTTAVAQWLALRRPAQAWATLDRSDNDRDRLWHTLIHSLSRTVERVKSLSAPDASALSAPLASDPCTALLSALQDHARSWSCPDRLIWVWDDVHTIREPTLLDELSRFLDYIPDYLHVVLTARHVPELELSRRQVRHQLALIERDALSFEQSDIREWVTRRFQLQLDDQMSDALFHQTQGWAAAIQFSACRLTQTGQLSGPSTLTDDRLLDDYLANEVFPFLPQVLREALPALAAFPAFSERFCQAVLPQWDARVLLRALASSSLPCTEHRYQDDTQFVLHDLLRSWLRRRFGRAHLPEDVILRASQWYLNTGQLIEGLDLLAEYELWPQLSQALADFQKDLVQGGHYHRGRRVLETLPEPWCTNNPWVLYLKASRAFAEGNAQLSAALARQAQPLLAPEAVSATGLQVDDNAIEALHARFCFLQAHLARWRGDIEESARLTRDIDASRFTDQPHLQAWALKSKGADAFMRGASSEGVRFMTRAVSAATASGDRICLIATLSWLIPALIDRGEVSLAEVFLRDARQQLDGVWTHHPVYAVNHYFSAILHRKRGELVEAKEAMARAWAHAGDALNPYHAVYFRLHHWWIHLSLGDLDEATRAATELIQMASQFEGRWPFLTPPPDLLLKICEALRGNPMPLVEWALSVTPETLTGTPEQQRMQTLLWLKVRLQFEPPDMGEHFDALLSVHEREGQHACVAQTLLLKARWHWQRDEKDTAAEVLTRALTRVDPFEMPQIYRDERPELDPLLHHVRQQPGMQGIVSHILGGNPIGGSSQPQNTGDPLVEPLSKRELEMLSWLKTGQSNQAIADALHISTATVKTHLRNLYGKLGVKNRAQAVIRAVETGILEAS